MVAFAALLATAADFRGGNRVVIGSDETFDGDLYVVGSSVQVKGTVNGDLIAAAGTVSIDGQVRGDVIATAGTVSVDGGVDGSIMVIGGTVEIAGSTTRTVRVLGGSLSVDGHVGRDVAVAAGSFHLGKDGRVSGDVAMRGGAATLDGTVEGRVTGAGDNITIGGNIKGDTRIDVTRLILEETATMDSNLVYTSDNEALIKAGAIVRGNLTHSLPSKAPAAPVRSRGFWPGFLQLALVFLMQVVVGGALVALFPRLATRSSEALAASPWKSLGWGLIFLITSFVLALLLMVTIIGLPLGMMGLSYYLTVVFLSQIIVAIWAGRLLVSMLRNGQQPAQGLPLFAALVVGLVIITAISALPFPYMRSGVIGVTLIFGTGALWLGQRSVYRQLRSAGMV
ncbi:MAG: hypothetical protein HY677_04990 [Chloroflexi bacterium]|nr:hypothetical protein [Chloroflexota bacterium]